MAIIVEDGTGVTGANSYVSTTTLTTFATARSVTLTAGAETLLIQAMDYIESQRYKGLKVGYTQVLQWPRYDVYIDGYYATPTDIPQQLKDALCHAAIAVDQGTDLLQDASRTTSMEKVGDLEVHYAPGSLSSPINVKIQNALYKLLDGGGSIRVGKG
jgi:ATP phosphoribosyltransferase